MCAVVREDEGDIDGVVVGLECEIVRDMLAGASVLYAMGAAGLLEEEAVCAGGVRALWTEHQRWDQCKDVMRMGYLHESRLRMP